MSQSEVPDPGAAPQSVGLGIVVALGLWHIFNLLSMTLGFLIEVMRLSESDDSRVTDIGLGVPLLLAGLATGWLAARYFKVSRQPLWVAVLAALLGLSYFRWIQFVSDPGPDELIARAGRAVAIVVGMEVGYLISHRRSRLGV